MTIKDTLEETYSALSAKKVRSGLTILGIVIGISSVIAMVSIGTGASSQISSSIESLGSNLIQVMPGAQKQAGGFTVSLGRGGAKPLTNADADAIASSISNINATSPEVNGRHQITAKGTNTNTSVIGSTSAYPAVHNLQVDAGDFISESQNA